MTQKSRFNETQTLMVGWAYGFAAGLVAALAMKAFL